SGDLCVASNHRNQVRFCLRVCLRFADEAIQWQFETRSCFLEDLGEDQMAKAKMRVLHGSSASFVWVRILARPSANTRLSSWENRSRSCLIIVPPGSVSSQ